jgi:uncharacterized membrane-anchored protein
MPEVALIFWVAKLDTTAFGEAFSDYVFFNDYIGRNAAILMGLGFLAVCLALQFSTKRYVPWVYWLTVMFTFALGASFADWLSVPAPYGDGLQLGTGVMSVVGGSVLFVIIAYIVVRHRSTQLSQAQASQAS